MKKNAEKTALGRKFHQKNISTRFAFFFRFYQLVFGISTGFDGFRRRRFAASPPKRDLDHTNFMRIDKVSVQPCRCQRPTDFESETHLYTPQQVPRKRTSKLKIACVETILQNHEHQKMIKPMFSLPATRANVYFAMSLKQMI